jgi:hypothetical protein
MLVEAADSDDSEKFSSRFGVISIATASRNVRFTPESQM